MFSRIRVLELVHICNQFYSESPSNDIFPFSHALLKITNNQDHLRMNVALDRIIILGVHILLDHRSIHCLLTYLHSYFFSLTIYEPGMIYKYLVWRGLEKHPGVTSYYRAVHNLGCWTLKETGWFPIWNSNWFNDVFFYIERYGSPAQWASLFQHHTRACSSTGSQSWPWTLCFLDPGQRIRRRNQNKILNIFNLVKQRKREEKSTFFLNICPLVATWSTSTEKSEPSPRPQYIRPEVIWNFKQKMSRALFSTSCVQWCSVHLWFVFVSVSMELALVKLDHGSSSTHNRQHTFDGQ